MAITDLTEMKKHMEALAAENATLKEEHVALNKAAQSKMATPLAGSSGEVAALKSENAQLKAENASLKAKLADAKSPAAPAPLNPIHHDV